MRVNPIRAGIVSNLTELNKYPYCGHSAVMGRENRPWQDVDYVSRYFGKTAHSARKAFRSQNWPDIWESVFKGLDTQWRGGRRPLRGITIIS